MLKTSSALRSAEGVRVLFVDLNNFARYPTVAIGYLTAALRAAGARVDVLSPLSVGVPGLAREPRARPWGRAEQRIRYRTGVSRSTMVRSTRARLAAANGPTTARARRRIVARFREELAKRPDVALISAYLLHYETCREISQLCAAQGVPVIVGGGYFSQAEVVEHWACRGGFTVFAGEAEPFVADLVRCAADGGDLSRFPGVANAGLPAPRPAPPLKELGALPFPDYGDFPWHAYPHRIVPVISGRGCGWGACSFCSDVTSSSGRTFRSRTPEHVLEELRFQARTHDTPLFVFTDLKLNSSPSVWEALICCTRAAVPAARWVGAVHVGARGDDGLGLADLRSAQASGLTRMTTGLESGSQPLLDRMKKGTDLAETSRFLHDARAAGISVRATMVMGHPAEEASDVLASAEYLARHEHLIDRVILNRFVLVPGTALHRHLGRSADDYPGLRIQRERSGAGVIDHVYEPAHSPDYRRAIARLIDAAHRINRRRLPPEAREFDGVM